MKRLLLLCGGQSPEHTISIRSCKNILGALDRDRFSVTLIGISSSGSWVLLDESELEEEVIGNGKHIEIRPGQRDCFWCHGESLGFFDVVFPILHGPNGEDGSIQGMMQLLGIPFVGPGIISSSVCMDKDVSKRLLKERGVNVAAWLTLHSDEEVSFDEVKSELGLPLYVKPANMGSSVGVHKVENAGAWGVALSDAFKYDKKVLVEESIQGREIECAVLGNQDPKATGLGEVVSSTFYSYQEKYDANSQTETVIPANIEEKYVAKLRSTALKSYKALECEGMSRVDMFLTEDGDVFVNEVNTIPGFTSISMYPKLWEQEGLSYGELLNQLMELAIAKGKPN